MIQTGPRTSSDPKFRAIITAVILLVVAHAVMFLRWGLSRNMPELPWFVPLTHSCLALAALSVAILALGRYRVLRDPASYWIGAGCLAHGVGYIFYVLTWPGLLPNGSAMLGHLPGTSAWIAMLPASIVSLCFLLAALLPRPAGHDLSGRRWLWSILCWPLLIVVYSIGALAFETSLPRLVTTAGAFTPLLLGWQASVVATMAAGSVFSARKYLLTGDTLLWYVTLTQIAVVFGLLGGIAGARRYSLVFAADRLLVCAAFVAMMFGLLLEYVNLFRVEREKTEDLARAQAAAHLGSWRWDILKDIVTWSEELYRVFGVDPKTFVPSNVDANALLHPDDRARHAERVGIALTGETVPPFESRIVRGNGEERIVLASGFEVVFDHKGKPITLFGTVLDITERKRAEQALIQSEARYRELSQELEQRVQQRTAQLEAVNKELESFSYSVSHDLRAPLRTLDGFSQALLENANNFDDKGRHYLERIRAGTERMRHLIDGLLQLSRLTRAELQTSSVDLSELARIIVEDLRSSEPDRNVEVEIQPALHANGDPRLLQAALQNLLANAWKFTSRSDSARIEFGCMNNRPNPAFFVRDNGAGFDMKRAENLFAPFQRLHADAEFQGSGIGLATVQRIIRRHHGRIWAEAVPGQGATFYFEVGKPDLGGKA